MLSLLTYHPIALYILVKRPGNLSNRVGYIVFQAICIHFETPNTKWAVAHNDLLKTFLSTAAIWENWAWNWRSTRACGKVNTGHQLFQLTFIVYEWTLCWIARIYPLAPYPGLYCDGLLCRLALPQQTVVVSVSLANYAHSDILPWIDLGKTRNWIRFFLIWTRIWDFFSFYFTDVHRCCSRSSSSNLLVSAGFRASENDREYEFPRISLALVISVIDSIAKLHVFSVKNGLTLAITSLFLLNIVGTGLFCSPSPDMEHILAVILVWKDFLGVMILETGACVVGWPWRANTAVRRAFCLR